MCARHVDQFESMSECNSKLTTFTTSLVAAAYFLFYCLFFDVLFQTSTLPAGAAEFVVNVTWMTVVAANFTTTPCFVDGCCSNKLLTIVKLAGGESGNDGGKI